MAPEAGWDNDPVRPLRCPGLQAGPFLRKSCSSIQPGYEGSRVGGDSTCPRVQARRWRRKHRTEEDAGGTPALPGGTTLPGSNSRTLPNLEEGLCCFRQIKGPCLRDIAIPSRITSVPWRPFAVLRVFVDFSFLSLFQTIQPGVTGVEGGGVSGYRPTTRNREWCTRCRLLI